MGAESKLLAAMELKRSDPAEALPLLRTVLRDAPSHAAVARIAASIIMGTGLSPLEEAFSLLHRALALSPADARTIHGLGVATFRSSVSPSAFVMYFSRAVAADPSNPAARCAQGGSGCGDARCSRAAPGLRCRPLRLCRAAAVHPSDFSPHPVP